MTYQRQKAKMEFKRYDDAAAPRGWIVFCPCGEMFSFDELPTNGEFVKEGTRAICPDCLCASTEVIPYP